MLQAGESVLGLVTPHPVVGGHWQNIQMPAGVALHALPEETLDPSSAPSPPADITATNQDRHRQTEAGGGV